MKNYIYRHTIEEKGFVEVSETEYTAEQIDMKNFVESMSEIIKAAKCGWDGVKYKVMKCSHYTNIFMVLYCIGGGERYIPIYGNSKGCNFSVLGENLW